MKRLIANDNIERRRLLMLLPFPPRLDATHGGSRAMAQLIFHLAAYHDIALVYLQGEDEPPIDPTVAGRCALAEQVRRPADPPGGLRTTLHDTAMWLVLLAGRPTWVFDWSVPAFAQRVRALAREWQPEIVHVEYNVMAQYCSALADCPAPRVLTLYDLGAATARQLWQERKQHGRVLPFLNMHAWERYEQAMARKVQAVVVLTERDRAAFLPYAGDTPVRTIALGMMMPEHPSNARGESANLLFVGSFEHTPNIEAVRRLITAILPRVQTLRPDVTLSIVGANPPLEIRQMASGAIDLAGWVPDVAPYLDRAALVAAPISLGGGMRIKVLEALAHGKALVASPLALAGLDVVHGTHVVAADSDEQFVQAIVRLLDNPAERERLGSNARAWALAHLDWKDSMAAYASLYDELLLHEVPAV